MLQAAYADALQLAQAHTPTIHDVAEALLVCGVLGGEKITCLVRGGPSQALPSEPGLRRRTNDIPLATQTVRS